MRSSFAALLGLVVGCGPIDTQLTISRGAPAIPAGIGEAEQVRPVSLPARPLLNRYDLLNHYYPAAQFPTGFVDYLEIACVSDESNERGASAASGALEAPPCSHTGPRDTASALEAAPCSHTGPRAEARRWFGAPREQWTTARAIATRVHNDAPLDLPRRFASSQPIEASLGPVQCHLASGCPALRTAPSRWSSFFAPEPLGAGNLWPVAYQRKGDAEWILDTEHPAATMEGLWVRPYPAVTISTALLSFVHLTDVQLREATARVGSPKQSKGLDKFVDSFEHDFEQDLFVDVVLHALVQTINRTLQSLPKDRALPLVERQLLRPTFAIHTGDAIDVGLMSELRTFHRLMDRLAIPWLSAIGNHDVLAFGNLIPGEPLTTDALAYGAKSDLRDAWWWRLLGRHLANGRWSVDYDPTSCPGCEDELVATGEVGTKFAERFIDEHARHGMAPRRFGPRCDQGEKSGDCVTTTSHGFDLGPKLNATPLGYYAFDLGLGEQADGGYRYLLRVLVLNTDEFGDPKLRNRGGEGGYVSEDQFDWLATQLAWLEDPKAADNRLMLVFGHHPLSTIRRDLGDNKGAKCDREGGSQARLRQLLGELARTRRLLGYFAGHKHGHEIALQETCGPKDPRKRDAFWEVQTGSIIGFPQEARWVTLRVLSDRLGFLELLPFGQQVVAEPGSPLAETLARAERGAKRDKCRKRPCIDGEPIRDGKHGAVRLFLELPAKPASREPSMPWPALQPRP